MRVLFYSPAIIQIQCEYLQTTLTLATRATVILGTQSSQGSCTSNGRISNVSSQGAPPVPVPMAAEKGRGRGRPEALVASKGSAPAGAINQGTSWIRREVAQSDAFESPLPNHSFSQAPPPVTTNNPSPMTPTPVLVEVPSSDSTRKRSGEEERSPPRKRLRDLFPNLGRPFDIYKAFPGHDVVLVPASDEEEEDESIVCLTSV
jgi:hypothetical protein